MEKIVIQQGIFQTLCHVVEKTRCATSWNLHDAIQVSTSRTVQRKRVHL